MISVMRAVCDDENDENENDDDADDKKARLPGYECEERRDEEDGVGRRECDQKLRQKFHFCVIIFIFFSKYF